MVPFHPYLPGRASSQVFHPVTTNHPAGLDLTCKRIHPRIMENGADAPAAGAGRESDPSGFLSEIIGAAVTVKLNSGVVYKGACGSCVIAVVSVRRRLGRLLRIVF